MVRVLTKRRELVERGQALYDARIRTLVEPLHDGKFLALDVRTGEFEVDENMLVALDRLRARLRDAEPYVVRVGQPTAVSLGGSRVIAT